MDPYDLFHSLSGVLSNVHMIAHSKSEEMNSSQRTEERRRCERFSLKLHTRISPLDSGIPPLDILTENISSDGAFFETPKLLPEGLPVLLEVTLKRESGEGGTAIVEVRGSVLPARTNGIAVQFEKRARWRELENAVSVHA
jgi:PilZ domain